jgi:hypothetical protein
MSNAEVFTERSLLYRRTRLHCPTHGLQPVVTVTDGLATLDCDCRRSQSLPLQDGAVSVEHLASFDALEPRARKLFPVCADNETTSQRRWWEQA